MQYYHCPYWKSIVNIVGAISCRQQLYLGSSWYPELNQTVLQCWRFLVYKLHQSQIKVAFLKALLAIHTCGITVANHKCHTFVTRIWRNLQGSCLDANPSSRTSCDSHQKNLKKVLILAAAVKAKLSFNSRHPSLGKALLLLHRGLGFHPPAPWSLKPNR